MTSSVHIFQIISILEDPIQTGPPPRSSSILFSDRDSLFFILFPTAMEILWLSESDSFQSSVVPHVSLLDAVSSEKEDYASIVIDSS